MDDIIKRDLGILIWAIFLAFGTVLFYILKTLEIPVVLIFFAEFVWYSLDIFMAAVMWHYFKLQKADIPEVILKSSTADPIVNEEGTNTEINNT